MAEHAEMLQRDSRSLAIALGVTGVVFVAELVGGFVANSLALIADAVHMLSDLAALGLGLFALWLSSRPAPPEKTYGYYRTEILAALFNGILLVVVALYILYEAYTRLQNPGEVRSGLMLIVASIGLAANLASAFVLSGHVKENLNVRAAFMHVVSDASASVGTVSAALVIIATGFLLADPGISILIGLLIIFNAWQLTQEAIDVLMEAAPAHINLRSLEDTLLEVSGVKSVHDLHVWTVTSGLVSMSGHVVVEDAADRQHILEQVCEAMQRKYKLTHCTLQLEIEGSQPHEDHFW
ncbi:MAG: cation transporter [Chloroflexi bacterium]|nr:cation transporter [Chloroflexota bacterium]